MGKKPRSLQLTKIVTRERDRFTTQASESTGAEAAIKVQTCMIEELGGLMGWQIKPPLNFMQTADMTDLAEL